MPCRPLANHALLIAPIIHGTKRERDHDPVIHLHEIVIVAAVQHGMGIA